MNESRWHIVVLEPPFNNNREKAYLLNEDKNWVDSTSSMTMVVGHWSKAYDFKTCAKAEAYALKMSPTRCLIVEAKQFGYHSLQFLHAGFLPKQQSPEVKTPFPETHDLAKIIESEKDLEKGLVRLIKKLGGKSYKLLSTHVKGLPDRICLLPEAVIFFVEVKTTGEKPSLAQRLIHITIRNLGFKVYVLDSSEVFDTIKKYIEKQWNLEK